MGGDVMSRKKRDDEEMNATAQRKQTDRKSKIRNSFAKAVKANGKALERLSKN